MKNLIVIGQCKKVQFLSEKKGFCAILSFKGYFSGEKIRVIKVHFTKDRCLEESKDYIIHLGSLRLYNDVLEGVLLRYREVYI